MLLPLSKSLPKPQAFHPRLFSSFALLIAFLSLQLFNTPMVVNSLSTANTSPLLTTQPLSLQYAFSEALGHNQNSYHLIKQGDSWQVHTPSQAYVTRFDNEGLTLMAEEAQLQMSLIGIGYGSQTAVLPAAVPTSSTNNRLAYNRGHVTEWYVNGPLGLQQGFTISEPPTQINADEQPLVLALRLQSNLTAVVDSSGQSLSLQNAAGETVLRYGGLIAYDTAGTALPAWMVVEDDSLNLHVQTAGAIYPLTIDPYFQQAKVTASNAGGNDGFGYSVAISGDTAVMGAYSEDSNGSSESNNSANGAGAAYVFVRSGNSWSQQAYLKASNAQQNDEFGRSVAISGDTIVVGAIGEQSNGSSASNNSEDNAGAAYVFVRSGTTWSQQAYLKASNAEEDDEFGTSVAISGNTIVVGAIGESSNSLTNQNNNSFGSAGAAYVFLRSGTSWSQQAYLKASNRGSNDEFGISVGIDGDTIIVGAHNEDSNGSSESNNSSGNSGAAYVFLRSGTTWSQQDYLKASNVGSNDEFGISVAISGDTVVAGAISEDSNGSSEGNNSANSAGAAYVFLRSGTNWNQQAYLKAANAGSNDEFGTSVAIDGDVVAIGAPGEASNGSSAANNSAGDSGAVYVFLRSGSSWNQDDYLKTSDIASNDLFGRSVGISDNYIVAGAHQNDDNGGNSGSAYIFKRFVPELSVAATSADKAEGNSSTTPFTFTVTRATDTTGSTTVDYAVISSEADTADFGGSLPTGTVNFAATETSKTITINVSGDTTVEADEGFVVTLSNPSGTAEIVTATATGTIQNDDTATVTISGGAQNEGDSGTTAYVFTATLDVDVVGGFNVAYTTNDGTATVANGDYNDNDGSLNFTGTVGESKTITVSVNGDTIVEADETFTVAFGAVSGTSGGVDTADISTAGSSQTGAILNDDTATVTLSGGLAQNEGDSGTITYVFTATLDAEVVGGFSIAYSTNNGTATVANGDYTDNDGSLSFTGTAGESKTITVSVNGDTIVEADETFTVALGAVSGTSGGVDTADISTAGSSQTGRILNDDTATVTLSDGVAQNEGDSGTTTYVFTATLDAEVVGGFSIAYSTNNGTATVANGDYTDNDGSLSFTGTAGETQTITVNVNGDTIVEADESFTVNLGLVSATNPSAISTVFSPQTGTILNDDSAVVILSGGGAQVEGNSGSTAYVFTATVDNAVAGSFSVAYTTDDGTATTADSDYVDNDGSLIFTGTVGESKIITVNVNGDSQVEGDESFTVSLGVVSGSTSAAISTVGSPQTGTILNDDAGLSLAATDADKAEGNSDMTPFVFTVTRAGDVSGSASVDYAVSSSTADAADFGGSFPTGTVNFAATETSQLITINVGGDTMVEAAEGFTVTLSNPTSSVIIVTDTAVGTIQNDDNATVILSGGAAQNEGNAGSTTYTFTASLDAAVDGGFSVAYSTDDGTATTANGDYIDNDGLLSFAGIVGEMQTITVTVNGDITVESDESLAVMLGAISDVSGEVDTADIQVADAPQIGTILNDDSAIITLSSGTTQNEGDSGLITYIFTVTLDQTVVGGFTVAYTVDDDTATTADNDYVDHDGTLSFKGAADETQTITIDVIGDTQVEADERFTVSLGAVSNTSGGVNTADIGTAGSPQSGIIVNDDSGLAITATAADQAEGQSGTTPFIFTVVRFGDTSEALGVDYVVSGSSVNPADAADFGGSFPSGTLNFATTEISQTVIIYVSGDTVIEADETFAVTLANPSVAVEIGAAATGTIRDDDTPINGTVTLSGGIAQAEGNNGTTAYVFTATLDNAIDGGFEIAYTTDDGTATTADGDYVDNDGLLTFVGTAGESHTIVVYIKGDTAVETDESFTISLGLVSGTASGGAPINIGAVGSPQTGTINNDDAVTSTNSMVYLPVIAARSDLPDLIVSKVTVTQTDVVVEIRNIGNGPVTSDFWVDAYLGLKNPTHLPTAVNDIWPNFSPQGIVWGVDATTNPLPAGGTLILRFKDVYQDNSLTSFTKPLAAGTPVYVQVDSANVQSPDGGVWETHERDGGAYNNISGPVLVP